MYYVLLSPGIDRQRLLDDFKQEDIWPLFHYVPLHSSRAGRKFGRAHGDLAVTNSVAERIVRLPLWVGLSVDQQERVVGVLEQALSLIS
jgi:dTDP-4-amino-4,6-dideoxygalactose transaminase